MNDETKTSGVPDPQPSDVPSIPPSGPVVDSPPVPGQPSVDPVPVSVPEPGQPSVDPVPVPDADPDSEPEESPDQGDYPEAHPGATDQMAPPA